MKDYTCEHCGGRIKPSTMRCEYCGTQYKIENDRVLRIETFQNPVETFCVEEIIPIEKMKSFGAEQVSEMALKHLTKKLAESITPMMMQIDSEYDFSISGERVRATIKVVRPYRINRK